MCTRSRALLHTMPAQKVLKLTGCEPDPGAGRDAMDVIWGGTGRCGAFEVCAVLDDGGALGSRSHLKS